MPEPRRLAIRGTGAVFLLIKITGTIHIGSMNIFALLTSCIALVTVTVFAASHSFDQASGVLAVDYAGYLSKHKHCVQ
jgi:uncharacterized membrane protein